MLYITPEERATLQFLADGKEASDIAGRLRVPESHIDKLLTALFERLGVTGRTEAVAAAARRALVVVDPALHAAPSPLRVDIAFEGTPMRLRVQAVALDEVTLICGEARGESRMSAGETKGAIVEKIAARSAIEDGLRSESGVSRGGLSARMCGLFGH